MKAIRFYVELVETISELAGRVAMWLSTLLVVLICFDVLARYLFSISYVWVFELEWHIFALLFLFGASFSLKYDRHVRVDIIYNQLNEKQKAWINLLGCLLFLFPFCVIVIEASVPYLMTSLQLNEASNDQGGLPARYFIKSMIIVGFVFLMMQGTALVVRSLLVISNKKLYE